MSTTVWAVLVAAGVPSAVFGLLMRHLNKKLDKRDAARERREKARIEHEKLSINLIMAAISLCEATAEAVQRIPDAHCNGDMHDALAYARRVKQEYRDFEREQTVRSIT